jgi:CRP-like cAMP-binding protein
MIQSQPRPLVHGANCAYCAARPLGVCGALGDGEAFQELRDAQRGMRVVDAGGAIDRQGEPPGDLFELAVRSSGRAPSLAGETLKIPLNQQLISEAAGLTAIHVNRVLRRLREGAVLEFRSGVLTVLNPDEFRLAAGATETLETLWSRTTAPG